jgi:hypothetical protein
MIDGGRGDGEKEDNNVDLVITGECCDDTVDMDQDTEVNFKFRL